MNITRLQVNDLYGKKYDIKFNEKLTILYGLNGSGKTTILDIVYYILSGDLNKLINYNFSYLKFEFEINKEKSSLTISSCEEELIVELSNLKFAIKKRLVTLLERHEKPYEFSNIDEDDIFILKKKLLQLSETVYIPLGRRVRGNMFQKEIRQRVNKKRLLTYGEMKEMDQDSFMNQRNFSSSIKAAKNHFELHKQIIVREENNINKALRNEMVENFSVPIKTDIMKADDYDFSKLEEKMNIIFNDKKNFKNNINELLTEYNNTKFSYVKKGNEIEIKDGEVFVKHISAFVQLSKLSEIEPIAYKQKEKIDLLKDNLENVLNSINSLLKDTNKQIKFNEKDYELVFSNNDIKDNELDLMLLSSGEKQIVIFFVFSLTHQFRRKNKLLLIDEPELSLHIEWQSKLLDLLMKNNNSSQIIIATHSPDVIGDYKEHCTEVRGISQ
ncbi:AAA family ATPase [Bacillus altitudinis]|uniref:AAA family ATPase n=1 Tax=Bacillus altitudinis TaxID=293387 RepID=UPI00301A9C3E